MPRDYSSFLVRCCPATMVCSRFLFARFNAKQVDLFTIAATWNGNRDADDKGSLL